MKFLFGLLVCSLCLSVPQLVSAQVTAREYLEGVVEVDLVASAMAGVCPTWRVSEKERTSFASEAVQVVADAIGTEKALNAWSRALDLSNQQRAQIVIDFLEENGLAPVMRSGGACAVASKLSATNASFARLLRKGG